MMNIRRRSGLLFLAVAFICFSYFVFSHKDSFPVVQIHGAGHREKASCLEQNQRVSTGFTPNKLPAGHPFIKTNPDALTPESERPLITYVYYETDFARPNLQFFLDHALHDAADFVFILNGETDVEKLIFRDPYADVPADIKHLYPSPGLSNVFVKKRPNTCFDLGAHAEVLQSAVGNSTGWIGVNGPIDGPIQKDSKGQVQLLRHRYNRFIMLNGSIRGPFFPAWSRSCWSDVYLNRLTQRIKLVGMSYNCHFGNGHVQSMIWATDKIGLALMLTKEGMGECFAEIGKAMESEVRMTKLFRDNNYEVDAFLSNYHSMDKQAQWARMRARMNAGLDTSKRGIAASETDVSARSLEDNQMGDVAANGPPASWEYDTQRPTAEEEERMVRELQLEPPIHEHWNAPKPERLPLFPKSKREAPAAAAAEAPPLQDEAHHPYADISAQHQNYTKKLLEDTLGEPGYFWRKCRDEDWLGRGSYAGSFVHPFENLFMKSHRGIQDSLLGNLTVWADGAGTNSWDVCH